MTEAGVMGIAQGFSVLYGLVIGSFLNVCIARLPEDRSLLPSSACPSCGGAILWHDNIPVLSWLALRGACRHCGSPISPAYPLVEVLGGLLAWLLFRRVVPTILELDVPHLAAWTVQFTFLSLLVVAAYVDVRHRIIPDQTSIYAVPVGIAGTVLLQVLGYDGWLSMDWRAAVLGAALWGTLFATTAWVALYLTDRVALGRGDVKLAAMLGAFLGPVGAFLVVMWGSILAAMVGVVGTLVLWRRVYWPYGPPIAIAAAVYVLWGEMIATRMFPHLVSF